MVVVRVDLRHISDEKKLSYSDVLWQYVKQDFLWRINNAGLGKVLWLQKPYFVTGEKLAFYYVYGSPGGRAGDNGTPFDVLRNIIIGNAGLNSHSDVVWTNAELPKQTAKVSANEPDASDMQPLIHTWNLSDMCDGGEVPFAVRLERLNEADAGVPMTKNIVFMINNQFPIHYRVVFKNFTSNKVNEWAHSFFKIVRRIEYSFFVHIFPCFNF